MPPTNERSKASDEAGAMLGTVRENLPQRSRSLEHGYKASRGTLTKQVVELTGKSSRGTLTVSAGQKWLARDMVLLEVVENTG